MTRYGFLSTYPPTRCGLATFTEALAGSLPLRSDEDASIVRVLDELDLQQPADLRARTRAELISGDRGSMARATIALNGCDVAIVQHEYGIYGGADGDEVLDVLSALKTPSIVVLHTVLTAPTPHQREVLIEVCQRASAVVVMTHNAGEILADVYGVDHALVHVIPHGVTTLVLPDSDTHDSAQHVVKPTDPKRILTWGLISPGKGIEWGIRALAVLGDANPALEYVVAGQTHPKVLAHDGESYRTMLSTLARELGVDAQVRFDGRYRDRAELAALVATADVVLLPYDSRDQATSGVLAEAVAAGIPVVATGFPHARELLAGGAGLIANHEDPESIAAALRVVLSADAVAARIRDAALRSGGDTTWTAVADQYRSVAATLLAARAA